MYFGNHRKRVWNAKHSGALAIAKLEKEVASLKHRVSELEAVSRRVGADPSPLGSRAGVAARRPPDRDYTNSIGRTRAAVKHPRRRTS